MDAEVPAADPAAEAAAQRALFLRVFPSVMLPMFMGALDQTIVATALPAIAGSLGEVGRISWVVVSYLIATTIAAPVYGSLGDALGRKRLLMVAIAVFVLTSLLCAAAPTLLLLVAARVLQGFGGGGLLTLSQALIGETVPPRVRGRYQGYLSAVFVCASTFGPVVGGLLTQGFGWRSVFAINLPLGLLAALLVARLPVPAAASGRLRFDWAGAALLALFVTPLLLGLEQVQRLTASALTIFAGLLAVSLGALALLLRTERRATAPLLPLRFFGQPAIWRTDLMAFCLGGAIVSLISFLPIYLEVVRDRSPAGTGLLLLPLTAGIGIGSLFTGRAVARTQRTTIFPRLGLCVAAAVLLALAASLGALPTWALPPAFAVVSLTIGTGMPVVQIITQIVAGPARLGAASASVQFSRSIGAAFGTAITGVVLFAALQAHSPATAALFVNLVQQGPGALAAVDAAARPTAQAAIGDAFRLALLTIAGYAACAWGLAWIIPVRRI